MTATKARETRNFRLMPEIRSEGENDGGMLVGYASKFNDPIQPYFDYPEFTEIVHPDAFTRTLKEMPDVRALRNHDPNLVLGRVKSGTLRLAIDAEGLAFENDLNPKTSAGRDTRADVERGDIDGCSIGFCVVKDDVVSDRETGKITRTLLDVDLFEITPACTFPANENASVSLRSAMNSRIGHPPPPIFRSRLAFARAIRRRIDL